MQSSWNQRTRSAAKHTAASQARLAPRDVPSWVARGTAGGGRRSRTGSMKDVATHVGELGGPERARVDRWSRRRPARRGDLGRTFETSQVRPFGPHRLACWVSAPGRFRVVAHPVVPPDRRPQHSLSKPDRHRYATRSAFVDGISSPSGPGQMPGTTRLNTCGRSEASGRTGSPRAHAAWSGRARNTSHQALRPGRVRRVSTTPPPRSAASPIDCLVASGYAGHYAGMCCPRGRGVRAATGQPWAPAGARSRCLRRRQTPPVGPNATTFCGRHR